MVVVGNGVGFGVKYYKDVENMDVIVGVVVVFVWGVGGIWEKDDR